MPRPEPTRKLYAITDLTDDFAMWLNVAGQPYEVVQFTASFALNEIPSAQCMLAVGRRGKDDTPAAANSIGLKARQMEKASVWLYPKGEYAPLGRKWPDKALPLFDGYYVGFSYRKLDGKTMAVVNLTHWLVDLAMSSTLSANSHPSNPWVLTAPNVLQAFVSSATGAGQPAYLSEYPGLDLVQGEMEKDFWGGLKKLFTHLCTIRSTAVGEENWCKGSGKGDPVENTRALRALKRIEGPGKTKDGDTTLEYLHGVPLKFDTLGLDAVKRAVAAAVIDQTVDNFAGHTFWDKMVAEIFPSFHLAVVPMVETAVVIADTPAYNGGYWMTLNTSDYDSLDQNANLERPLRAVGVFGQVGGSTGLGYNDTNNPLLVGGCYVAGSVDENDGVVLYIDPPRWLNGLSYKDDQGAKNTGVVKNEPTATATQPAQVRQPDAPGYEEVMTVAGELYLRYAHAHYAAHTLRGRVGSLSGKLRLDIAPGSSVRVLATGEKFLAAEDQLAVNVYAQVARVTVSVNFEAALAGTSFQLTHIRTEQENKEHRTSVPQHPLWGLQLHGKKRGGKPTAGAPLVKGTEDLEIITV